MCEIGYYKPLYGFDKELTQNKEINLVFHFAFLL